MDQNFKLGVTIGYGDLYLEYLFRHFKLFRLFAVLDDDAGAVREHSGKGPRSFYMVGRGPKSCFFGLLFALMQNSFCILFSILLIFWKTMSCIVLDNKLAVENVKKELGIFTDGNVQMCSSYTPRKQTHKASFWVYKKFASNCAEQWKFWLQWAPTRSTKRYTDWTLCKSKKKFASFKKI